MTEGRRKAMIISVGTGKEGKDIAHGICFSIQQQNPDMLLFLHTEESKRTTMPFVIEDCKLKGRQWKEFNLSDVDDIERIALECQGVIQELVREGYNPRTMVVDYTSGTKAMSAGVTIASIREGIGTLTYVSGKRGEGGRVITGTERTLSIIPNQIFAADLFKEALANNDSEDFGEDNDS
jgi:hypothetical protein